MQPVGYQLVDESGTVFNQWGGIWGQNVPVPDYIDCPNGDRVYCPQINVVYGGVKLIVWEMDAPPAPPSPTLVEIQAQLANLSAQIAALSSSQSTPNG
jgi:hypothetical protein